MNDDRLKAILQSIVDHDVPAREVDLWPKLSDKVETWQKHARRRRSFAARRIVLYPAMIVVLILAIALAWIGPDQALAALRGLLGYIPGIGFVDDTAGLRVLASPVTAERDGITLTVQQAVLDLQRTVIVYQIDGVSPAAYPRQEEERPREEIHAGPPTCNALPELHLTDGTVLTILTGGGTGWSSGWEARLVYPAIPAGVNQAAFVLPCIEGTSPGAAPEGWVLDLAFVTAPPEMTVAPVIEASPPVEETPPEGEAAGSTGLVLEKVIELEDGYILIGSFRRGELFPGAIVHGISAWPEITDADGQAVPFEIPSDIDLASEEFGVFPWAYKIPRAFGPPLTITLDAVDVEFPAEVTFQIDTGADPQEGQEWSLDRDYEIAGHTVHLVSVVRHSDGYEFLFRSDGSVSGVSVVDPMNQPVGGYGGGSTGEFTTGFVYSPSVPSGLLSFQFVGILASQPGPWTLTWAPPAGSEPAPTAELPQVCLTQPQWLGLLEANEAPSENLTGKLIAYGRIVDDGLPLSPDNAGVFVVDLADESRQILGPGTWPSLSKDGASAAYGGSDGLHIVDLASGDNRLVPGTLGSDYKPRWSPDGLQVAFIRTDDLNMYVVNIDGSDLRKVTDRPEYELLSQWMPDGSGLSYVVPTREGLRLRFLDLSSRESRDGPTFDFSKQASAAISPDGQRIAFVGKVPVGMETGLYLANLDGSHLRLITGWAGWGGSDPGWSPDGAWLIVTLYNGDETDPLPIPALINPETCQTIPLSAIEGNVQGWGP